MSTAIKLEIDEKQYIDAQLEGGDKCEYIEGQVYLMAGASEEHNIISGNIYAELRQKLKGKDCRPFIADMMLKAADNIFYPDVMVICEEDERDTKNLKHAPVIVVEVLSHSTRKTDITLKKLAYMKLPSVKEYVLVEQDKCEVEVFRRVDQHIQSWASSYYLLGDDIHFASLDVTISVAEIYDAIDNADVETYLASL